MTHFYLYLDESGEFDEHSMPAGRPGGFASQLAGFLVERDPPAAADQLDQEIERQAEDLMRDAYVGAPQKLEEEHHSNTLIPVRRWTRDQYNRLVHQLVRGLRGKPGWQAVRLVNAERIGFDDRIETYTRMIAELAVHICRQKKIEGTPSVSITLVCANYNVGTQVDPKLLTEAVYRKRLREAFLLARVRHGFADDWSFHGPLLRSGRFKRSLQVCDVLSHSSHADFHNCSAETRSALVDAFGSYDFPLVLPEILSRVDRLAAEGLLGQAIIALAERLYRPDANDRLRDRLYERLDRLVASLGRQGAAARDVQLSPLVTWLEQLVDHQRVPEVGDEMAEWLKQHVSAPLRAIVRREDAQTLDWFEWGLDLWALTASNHRGDLARARSQIREMGTQFDDAPSGQSLLASLAGKWEHAGLLLHGLVTAAVHQTDCFEYDAASRSMESVAGCYGHLAAEFSRAYPAVFTARIRSDWRGRALGTWLQCETFAGLRFPERLQKARELSDLAIDEFTSAADRERQYQYRSHIETAAGDFDRARKFLAQSLRLSNADSHADIGQAIARLAEHSPVAARFALLHWLRLGVGCLTTHAPEGKGFYETAFAHGFLERPWGIGGETGYPVHGILRRVARIHVFRGQVKRGIEALDRLCAIDPIANGQIVLGTVQLAALAEAAQLCWRQSIDQARAWLKQLADDVDRIRSQTAQTFPRIWELFADWPDTLVCLLGDPAPENASELLDRLSTRAGEIPY